MSFRDKSYDTLIKILLIGSLVLGAFGWLGSEYWTEHKFAAGRFNWGPFHEIKLTPAAQVFTSVHSRTELIAALAPLLADQPGARSLLASGDWGAIVQRENPKKDFLREVVSELIEMCDQFPSNKG